VIKQVVNSYPDHKV